MKRFAIFYGAARLGWLLIKASCLIDVIIYRCPDCNLVVKYKTPNCIRCDASLDWRGIEK